MDKWLKDEIKVSFKKKLKEANNLETCEQIQQLRHNVVAHRIFDSKQDQIVKIPGVSFPQLEKLLKSAEKLFSVCSFDVEYCTNLYWPTMTDPEPKAEDVVEILDLVVKNSNWLTQPERDAGLWQGIRQYKEKKELEELNRWRAKYGLPPA